MTEQPLKPCPLCAGPPDRLSGLLSCLDARCPVSESALTPRAWNALPRRSDAEPLVKTLEMLADRMNTDWREEAGPQRGLTNWARELRAVLTTYRNGKDA